MNFRLAGVFIGTPREFAEARGFHLAKPLRVELVAQRDVEVPAVIEVPGVPGAPLDC